MAPQPFVVAPPGGRALSDAAAADAAEQWGLQSPEFMRVGMNALYRCGNDVVLRVGRTTAPARQGVWLLLHLAAEGIAVPVPARAEVVERADGLSVIALRRLQSTGPIDWRAVGRMVRRLHDLEPAAITGHYPLADAVAFPHWNAERVRAEVDDLLTPADARAIDAAMERLASWRELCARAPQVLCHGDVHPGNVVQTAEGPVLLDWDLMCTGPAAWDHAAVLTWGSRWDGEAELYDQFADGYGDSQRGTSVGDALAEMRLLVATLMRVSAGRHDPSARHEAARRLRLWHGDVDAPRWRPA